MVTLSLVLEVTMEPNFKILDLKFFTTQMELAIIFLHIEPLNKIELLRRKNTNLEEMARTMLCANNLQNIFGQKPQTPLVILLIE